MSRDQVSDNWRRTQCRFAFLLGCLLPTFVIVYWILHPQTVGDWERTVLAELGVPTTIDSIETPGPYVTIFRGVQFTDSEFGQLFGATQIRVIRGTPHRVLIDHATHFSSQALVQLISQVSDHLIRGDRIRETWSIEFLDTATIFSDSTTKDFAPSFVMKDLKINIMRYANGKTAEISFSKEDDPTGNLVSCYMFKGPESQLQFGLETSGCYLPCWLLSDIVPDLNKLGNECMFAGSVEIRPYDQNNDEMISRISGIFADIDLSSLVRPYCQELQGKCTADVSNFVIKDEMINSLKARVRSEHGVVGLSMLYAAKQHLGFELSPVIRQLANAAGDIGFRNMQLNLEIKNGELFLSAGRDGVIATDDRNARELARFRMFGTEAQPLSRTLDDLANFVIPSTDNPQLADRQSFEIKRRFYRPFPSLVPESPIHMAEGYQPTSQH